MLQTFFLPLHRLIIYPFYGVGNNRLIFMNKINSLLSDSHLELNQVICSLNPRINNEQLGEDFDSFYAIVCLSNVRFALVESALLICKLLPEDQRSEFYRNLFSFDIVSQKDVDEYENR